VSHEENADTRQGDRIGRFFTLGSFLGITETALILGLLFSTEYVCINFFARNGLGNILVDFSQTLLVALMPMCIRREETLGKHRNRYLETWET
jgi:hypothetical protein